MTKDYVFFSNKRRELVEFLNWAKDSREKSGTSKTGLAYAYNSLTGDYNLVVPHDYFRKICDTLGLSGLKILNEGKNTTTINISNRQLDELLATL